MFDSGVFSRGVQMSGRRGSCRFVHSLSPGVVLCLLLIRMTFAPQPVDPAVILEVHGDKGTFLSPNYPSTYPNHQNLTYTAYLDTPGPLILRLHLSVDLESLSGLCYDYIQIQSSVYCGLGSTVLDIRINGSQFVMTFVSDYLVGYTGFNVTFWVKEVLTTEPADPDTSSLKPDSTSSSHLLTLPEVKTTTESSTAPTKTPSYTTGSAGTTTVILSSTGTTSGKPVSESSTRQTSTDSSPPPPPPATDSTTSTPHMDVTTPGQTVTPSSTPSQETSQSSTQHHLTGETTSTWNLPGSSSTETTASDGVSTAHTTAQQLTPVTPTSTQSDTPTPRTPGQGSGSTQQTEESPTVVQEVTTSTTASPMGSSLTTEDEGLGVSTLTPLSSQSPQTGATTTSQSLSSAETSTGNNTPDDTSTGNNTPDDTSTGSSPHETSTPAVTSPNSPANDNVTSAMTTAKPRLLRAQRGCYCIAKAKTAVTSEKEEEMAKVIQTLFLKKDNLSTKRRKYTSAPDHRYSAQTMGALGIIICALPMIFVLVTDLMGVCVRDPSRHARRSSQIEMTSVSRDDTNDTRHPTQ